MERSIEKVEGEEEIQTVAELAEQIWNEHYVPVIGQKQVDYMLEEFQSPEAIRSQVEKGYEYYLLKVNNEPAGYLALVPEAEADSLMLSKIYVEKSRRGKGNGTYLMEFARDRARELDLSRIWLRVNKHNDSSIKWYKKQGFTIEEEDKKSIGRGFYMNDYIMGMNL